jgi:hypothetical protein
LCCFQPFQLPFCSSFNFTSFPFFSTLNKPLVCCSRQNFWLLRYPFVLFTFHSSFDSGFIASLLVRAVLPGYGYVMRCLRRGRCRQIRTIDTSGAVNVLNAHLRSLSNSHLASWLRKWSQMIQNLNRMWYLARKGKFH